LQNQLDSGLLESEEEDELSEESGSYIISNYVKQQASVSYSTMVENAKLGEICLVETCYVFTGVKEKNISLLFVTLKQLMDSESNVSSRGRYAVCRRWEILKSFKTKLKFNKWQSDVEYPNSDLEHISMHKPFFTADFSRSLINFPLISIPLPLPQIKAEA